jgi:hypothetical protein
VYGSRNSVHHLRLPQFHATKARFPSICFWVLAHHGSLPTLQALLVPEKRIWEVGGRFNEMVREGVKDGSHNFLFQRLPQPTPHRLKHTPSVFSLPSSRAYSLGLATPTALMRRYASILSVGKYHRNLLLYMYVTHYSLSAHCPSSVLLFGCRIETCLHNTTTWNNVHYS